MKNDIKEINKNFLMTLLGLFGILLAAIGLTIVILVWVPVTFRYPLYIIILVALLFILPRFVSKIDRLTNLSYIIKIRGHEANPLVIHHLKENQDIYKWLKENDFIRFVNIPSHALYYKVTKDPIKKIFRKYVLEVIVMIFTKNDQYYLDEVDEEIHKIHTLMDQEKKRIFAMTITQIKRIKDLDQNMKEKLKEIVFVRTKRGIISTINIGLHDPSNQAVMLYSDSYSPSLYYRFHIDQIKHLI